MDRDRRGQPKSSPETSSSKDRVLGLAAGSKTIKKKLKTIWSKRTRKQTSDNENLHQELTEGPDQGPFFELAKQLERQQDHGAAKLPPDPNSLDLDLFLSDSANREDLHNFLRANYCEESLEFWLDYQQYKNICETQTLNDRRNKAIEIFTRYLSFAADKPINVDERASMSVCQSLAHPRFTTFDEAFHQVVDLLRTDCYQRYYEHKKQMMANLQSKSTDSALSNAGPSSSSLSSVNTESIRDFPNHDDLRSLVDTLKRNHEISIHCPTESSMNQSTCTSGQSLGNVSYLDTLASNTTVSTDVKNRSYSSYYKCLELPSMDEESISTITASIGKSTPSTKSDMRPVENQRCANSKRPICKRCSGKVKTVSFKLPEGPKHHRKRKAEIKRIDTNTTQLSSRCSSLSVSRNSSGIILDPPWYKTVPKHQVDEKSGRKVDSRMDKILVTAQSQSCNGTKHQNYRNVTCSRTAAHNLTGYRTMASVKGPPRKRALTPPGLKPEIQKAEANTNSNARVTTEVAKKACVTYRGYAESLRNQ